MVKSQREHKSISTRCSQNTKTENVFVLWVRFCTSAHLIFTMLGSSLRLVQTCQATIHALVQSPAADNGDPKLIESLQAVVQRNDGTLKDRSKGKIKLPSLKIDSGLLGLLKSLGGEADVGPTGETILSVPLALSVTNKHDLVCSHV
jgi:hypothetical protein